MEFDIIFAPEVNLDIQDAIDWYNGKQDKLGDYFLAELKKVFKPPTKSTLLICNQIRYHQVHTNKEIFLHDTL